MILILFLIVGVVLFLAGFFLKLDKVVTDSEVGCMVLGFVVVIICAIVFAFIPVFQAGDNAFLREYEATKQTIESFRNGGKPIESAALITSVVDMNNRIASKRYWANSIWFGIFFKDELETLESIK